MKLMEDRIRKDGIVDLGIWDCVPQSELMIPIDVHVARTARLLGLVSRKQNDRRTVEELTARLRELSPEDPVRYDFALFGVGEAGEQFICTLVEICISSCFYTISTFS